MNIAAPATFGEMLCYLRKRARLTQRELGIAVGYSEAFITRLEGNNRRPDPATVQTRFITALDLAHEPQLAQQLIDLAMLSRAARPTAADAPPLVTRTNLPAPLTRFIGRQHELGSVIEMARTMRMITLTGSGGVGKTRLAIEAGARLLDDFSDGVLIADLAPLGDAALVSQQVAAAFKITNFAGEVYAASLKALIGSKHLLLILDNCEHVIQTCAELVEALLHTCPNLHVLATSREPLNFAGEAVWRVPSMNREESAQLFVERACAVKTDFVMGEANAGDVAAVCARLDGIPLAIELAASRLGALSVKQIAARLDDRFNLLTSGNRAALPRHQTLRALIAWSYDVLSDQEHTLLCRLSVFTGGWTAEAAESVCATPRERELVMAALHTPNVLPLLLDLVNKSLVIASDEGEHTRFTMLETIRQFAWEQIEVAGEREWISRRHFDYFLALVQRDEQQPQLHVSAGRSSITQNRLQQDLDNVRVALDWIIAQRDMDAAFQLCLAMCPFWETRGLWSEGALKLQQLLALANDVELNASQHKLCAQALMQSAIFAWRQSNYAESRRLFNVSLERFQTHGEPLSAGSALSYLGGVAFEQGDYASALTFYEKALDIWNALPDPPRLSCSLTRLSIASAIFNLGDLATARRMCEERLLFHRQSDEKYSLSYGLNLLASIVFMQGDLATAKALYEESLALRRALDNKRGIAATLNDLGCLHVAVGEFQAAQSLHEESLRRYRQLGNRRGSICALSGLACVEALDGQLSRAVTLLAVVEDTRQAMQAALDEPIRSANERAVDTVRSFLNPPDFSAAWQAGRRLTLEQATEMALH